MRATVRIGGGVWKRTPLTVADVPNLRPTPDRVRETLFNWLGQDLTGWRCLDAFAGTGALGLEAASRGAVCVDAFELNPKAAYALQTTVDKLLKKEPHCLTIGTKQFHVHQKDVVRALETWIPASLDLIFLDPPFAQPELLVAALKLAQRALVPKGWAYVESAMACRDILQNDDRTSSKWANQWQIIRSGKAGAVHFTLLQLLHGVAVGVVDADADAFLFSDKVTT